MNLDIDTSKSARGAPGKRRLARAVAIAIATASLAVFASSGAYAQGHGGGRGGGGGAHFAHGGGPGWGHGGYWRGGGYRGGGWGCCGFGLGLGVGIGLGLPAYYYGDYAYGPSYVVGDPNVVYGTPQPVPLTDGSIPQPMPQQQSAPAPVIYPRNGQDAARISADSDACSQWAGKQPNATSDPSVFRRSVDACMDARGYTLR
jgi:hypothetical protein